MIKRILITLLQTLFISAILFSGYYFLYLKPNIQLAKNISQTETILTLHKNTLTQNRIAFVGLTHLNPDSPIFSLDTSNLLAILQNTENEGLDQINSHQYLPKTNILDSNSYSELLKKTENIYTSQQNLVGQIKTTKTYKEGLEILKSQDSINLLTNETKVILEYQYYIDKISN